MYNLQRGVRSKEVQHFDIYEGIYVTRIEIELESVREVFLKPMRINPLNHFSIEETEISKN